MKLPKDLRPGDRLYYSKTEYATVQNRLTTATPYFCDGCIRAVAPNGVTMFYATDNGTESCNDTPPIIRIERIASAPAKKRAKVDKDAAFKKRAANFILALADTYSEKDHYQNKPVRKTLRAIARRLEGGGK